MLRYAALVDRCEQAQIKRHLQYFILLFPILIAPTDRPNLRGLKGAASATSHLLMDGGIKRGTNVLKAIALGASAVLYQARGEVE